MEYFGGPIRIGQRLPADMHDIGLAGGDDLTGNIRVVDAPCHQNGHIKCLFELTGHLSVKSLRHIRWRTGQMAGFVYTDGNIGGVNAR